MYKTILRLYKKTGNKEIVTSAEEKGWISAEEAEIVLAEYMKKHL